MTRHAETLALHGGPYRSDPATGAVAPPIFLTTSYQFRDSEHARRLFYLEELGYTYTRTSNPGREVLERRIAVLEGGSAALAVAAGSAATIYALLNLAEAGDNVVVSNDVARGRNSGILTALRQFGIEIRLADPAGFADATDRFTRAYFGESLSVPALKPFPIAEVAAIGHRAGIPLFVDNSALPLTCRPLDLGATVVIYSAGEYLGGHGTTEGGLIIDGGTFPWEAHAERFPTLTRPDESYHGAVWVDVVKKWGASPFIARARGRFLRDFGGAISPLNVFQLIQGVETLPLRMRYHLANAGRAAAFLEGHAKVSDLAAGQGALIAFDLPDEGAAARFVEGLSLFLRTEEYGNSRSAVVGPTQTRRVLLSIGLEHEDDILADLAQALKRL